MRRKLINYEIFNKLQENSLTKAESELILAEPVISDALGEHVKLYSYGKDSVTFETAGGNYLHANYSLKGNNIVLENMEELVIDERSAKEKSKKLLHELLENVLNNNKSKADELFHQYITQNHIRRHFKEESCCDQEEKPKKGKKGKKAAFLAMIAGKKDKKEVKIKTKAPKKKLKEWNNVTEKVLGYLNYKEFGVIREHVQVKKDNTGNVVALKLPNNQARNEGKILHFNWKTLNTEVQVLRNKVKTEARMPHFMHAVNELREANAVTDNPKMEMAIENIVAKYPRLIYLNQNELSSYINNGLESLGETNYDDEMCNFMSEAILRKASEVYEDKVNKVMRIAGVDKKPQSDEYYETFQNVVKNFYPKIDSNSKLEEGVFVDLFNTLVEIHNVAKAERNAKLYEDTNEYLHYLDDVIEKRIDANFDLAEEVCEFLTSFIETNLETADWDVSNTPYVTTNGDNPILNTYAKKGYSPAADGSGDWGDPAPVSDGKTYGKAGAEEMRNHSWGNIGGADVYPDLKNPIAYPSDSKVWKAKSDNLVVDDGDDAFGQWSSGDTWAPEGGLTNPYLPKGVTEKSYKMKNDNLVVDQ